MKNHTPTPPSSGFLFNPQSSSCRVGDHHPCPSCGEIGSVIDDQEDGVALFSCSECDYEEVVE